MPGTLFLVATPIGNLEDITLRALRVLKDADLIAAEDTRRTAGLLNHFGIATRITSLHEHNERERIPALLRQVQDGLRLAVVTDAGMPGVSDPGYRIVRAAVDAGVTVEIIPGVSALTTALIGSGLPTNTATFLGFPPARQGERERWLRSHGDFVGTLVLFEAPGRVRQLLSAIRDVWGDREVVVAHELTKIHESWHRGTVSQVIETELPERGEFVVLVSDQKAASAPDADVSLTEADIPAVFGHLTNEIGLSRRDAISELAERASLPKRVVYGIVERAKSSVE